MGLIRGIEVAGRWLCKGLMLLAEGWSEVDSLDVGEKKRSNLSFSSSFHFQVWLLWTSNYTGITANATQERKIPFIEQRARYSVLRSMTQLRNRIACN